jgi:hypothetical protein
MTPAEDSIVRTDDITNCHKSFDRGILSAKERVILSWLIAPRNKFDSRVAGVCVYEHIK